jgi:hypothetical protein
MFNSRAVSIFGSVPPLSFGPPPPVTAPRQKPRKSGAKAARDAGTGLDRLRIGRRTGGGRAWLRRDNTGKREVNPCEMVWHSYSVPISGLTAGLGGFALRA